MYIEYNNDLSNDNIKLFLTVKDYDKLFEQDIAHAYGKGIDILYYLLKNISNNINLFSSWCVNDQNNLYNWDEMYNIMMKLCNVIKDKRKVE